MLAETMMERYLGIDASQLDDERFYKKFGALMFILEAEGELGEKIKRIYQSSE